MKIQITKSDVKETLAIIKGVSAKEIKNVNWNVNTFEIGKSIYSFDLTKRGLVKTGSVKFFSTVNNYQNCAY